MKTSYQKHRAKVKRTRGKADKLFQILVVKLNPYCVCCGRKSEVAHHYIFKSKSNYLRYSIPNGVALCKSCHFEIHHGRACDLSGLIVLRKGEDWYFDLVRDKNKRVSTTLGWYESKIKLLGKL